MTPQRASCCPHSYPKVPNGVSTHTQDYAALANAIPEGSRMSEQVAQDEHEDQTITAALVFEYLP